MLGSPLAGDTIAGSSRLLEPSGPCQRCAQTALTWPAQRVSVSSWERACPGGASCAGELVGPWPDVVGANVLDEDRDQQPACAKLRSGSWPGNSPIAGRSPSRPKSSSRTRVLTRSRNAGWQRRRECLDRVLDTGEWHLGLVLSEYTEHYNVNRPYRALRENPSAGRSRAPDPSADIRVPRGNEAIRLPTQPRRSYLPTGPPRGGNRNR